MSLETKIEALTKAVEALTAVMTQPAEPPQQELPLDTPEPEPKPETNTEGASAKDLKRVKALARRIISEGIDRTAIKMMITDLGGASISELDAAALAKLENQLEEINE